jgi:hypothetical protein
MGETGTSAIVPAIAKPQHGYQLPLTPEQFFKAGVAAHGCHATIDRAA